MLQDTNSYGGARLQTHKHHCVINKISSNYKLNYIKMLISHVLNSLKTKPKPQETA